MSPEDRELVLARTRQVDEVAASVALCAGAPGSLFDQEWLRNEDVENPNTSNSSRCCSLARLLRRRTKRKGCVTAEAREVETSAPHERSGTNSMAEAARQIAEITPRAPAEHGAKSRTALSRWSNKPRLGVTIDGDNDGPGPVEGVARSWA